MTPTKFISGFQTGADMGGILAATDLGLAVGGYMPQGFHTESGGRPEYADLYGAVELPESRHYGPRTRRNVRESDATLIFAFNPESAGTKLTQRYCGYEDKPFIVNPPPTALIAFLEKHSVGTANVAGNRESVADGIQERVRTYLVKTLGPHLQ